MLRFTLSTLLVLLAACTSATPAPRPLVVASDLDNRPFAWVDETGEPRGRDVEMMQMAARELGREIEWKRMPFDQLLPACERGEVDVVCATLGITEERAKLVRFTRPYFETSIAVVVRAGPNEPRSLAELEGKRVAGSPGTTSEKAIREHLPKSIGVFEGSKEAEPAAQRLASRAIDAAVMDGPAAKALVQLSSYSLAVLDEPLAAEHYALALPLQQSKSCAELDAWIERHHAELRELDARFGLRSTP